MKDKGWKFLSYFTIVFGVSLLGVAFVYYVIVLSASFGILISDYNFYNYVENSLGLNVPQLFCNLFFMLFSLGSVGAMLTYVGSVLIPQVRKHK